MALPVSDTGFGPSLGGRSRRPCRYGNGSRIPDDFGWLACGGGGLSFAIDGVSSTLIRPAYATYTS
eukprot:42236-Eustigmatos_ZCMA.PRE.1